ncbi:hypothetical protein FHU13_005560 [Methylobacterium sp. R2-1]|nr:hypothetical protein [Methylobacterium sp. R2-1]
MKPDLNEMKPFWMVYGVGRAGQNANIRQKVNELRQA